MIESAAITFLNILGATSSVQEIANSVMAISALLLLLLAVRIK